MWVRRTHFHLSLSLVLSLPAMCLAESEDQGNDANAPSALAAQQADNWKNSTRLNGPWGVFNSSRSFQRCACLNAEPKAGERWQTEESLRLNFVGPFSLFGQVGTRYDTLAAQESNFSSRTGLECKLAPLPQAEVLLRSGAALSYIEDPLRPTELPQERSQMLLELQCRYPLFGLGKLEYLSSAAPAWYPLDHSRFNQDLRFAVPLGGTGDVRLGARQNWQDAPLPRAWYEGMQFYLSVSLQR